ncbi:hypothetical protein D3C80_1761540 [compost metagenome]
MPHAFKQLSEKSAAGVHSVDGVVAAICIGVKATASEWRKTVRTVKAHQPWIEQAVTITQQVAYGRG